MYFGFNNCMCSCNPFMNFFAMRNFMNPIRFNNYAIGFNMPFMNPYSIFDMSPFFRQPVWGRPYIPQYFVQSQYQPRQVFGTNDVDDSRLVVVSNKTDKPEQTQNVVQTVKTEKAVPKSEPKQELVFGVPYNKQKGETLARNVVSILPKDRDPEYPLCARYVKLATAKSGLGPYVYGPNGAGCKNVYRANPNFKEVKVKGEDFDKLPAGSVVVYDAFDNVTNKKGENLQFDEDGHVLVALGDGRGCSDIIEDEILQSDNAYTFIPV